MKSVLGIIAQITILIVMDMSIVLSILSVANRAFVSAHQDETTALILSTILAVFSLLYLNIRPIIRRNLGAK